MPDVAKTRYESILQASQYRPLYAETWWLDATCGKDKWDVYFFNDEEENETGCLPYYTTKVGTLQAVITPPMTQWLSLITINNSTAIHLGKFLEGLGAARIIDISLKGGSEIINTETNVATNLKYSYVISGNADMNIIRSNYNEGLRRNLKEAEKKYTVLESKDVDLLIKLSKASYDQRKLKAPGWIEETTPRVFDALVKYSRGRIIFAFENNTPIAGIMTGWDSRTEYYLLGGRNESTGASAHSLLLDHAISHAISNKRQFDFEGSMHPGIANFFQSFGAKPESYLQIKKYRGAGKLWALLHR